MKHNLDFEKELKLDNPYKYDYSHSDKDEYWEYKRCDLISKYHSKLIESSELQAFIIELYICRYLTSKDRLAKKLRLSFDEINQFFKNTKKNLTIKDSILRELHYESWDLLAAEANWYFVYRGILRFWHGYWNDERDQFENSNSLESQKKFGIISILNFLSLVWPEPFSSFPQGKRLKNSIYKKILIGNALMERIGISSLTQLLNITIDFFFTVGSPPFIWGSNSEIIIQKSNYSSLMITDIFTLDTIPCHKKNNLISTVASVMTFIEKQLKLMNFYINDLYSDSDSIDTYFDVGSIEECNEYFLNKIMMKESEFINNTPVKTSSELNQVAESQNQKNDNDEPFELDNKPLDIVSSDVDNHTEEHDKLNEFLIKNENPSTQDNQEIIINMYFDSEMISASYRIGSHNEEEIKIDFSNKPELKRYTLGYIINLPANLIRIFSLDNRIPTNTDINIYTEIIYSERFGENGRKLVLFYFHKIFEHCSNYVMNKLNLNHNEYIKRVNFRITNLIRNSFDIDTAHSLEKHLKLAYEQYQKSYLKNESTSYSSLNPDEPPEMNNLNYEIQKVETFIEKI